METPNPTGGLGQGTGRTLTDALVARRVCLLVQLQLRLHVLGGECDADLDPSGQATWEGEEGTLEPGAALCPSSAAWLLPAPQRLSPGPLATRSGLGCGVPVLAKPLGTSHGSGALRQPGTLHRRHRLAMARVGEAIGQRGQKTGQNTAPMATVSALFPPPRHLSPSGAPHPAFIYKPDRAQQRCTSPAPLAQRQREPICRPSCASAEAQLSSSPSGRPVLTRRRLLGADYTG